MRGPPRGRLLSSFLPLEEDEDKLARLKDERYKTEKSIVPLSLLGRCRTKSSQIDWTRPDRGSSAPFGTKIMHNSYEREGNRSPHVHLCSDAGSSNCVRPPGTYPIPQPSLRLPPTATLSTSNPRETLHDLGEGLSENCGESFAVHWFWLDLGRTYGNLMVQDQADSDVWRIIWWDSLEDLISHATHLFTPFIGDVEENQKISEHALGLHRQQCDLPPG